LRKILRASVLADRNGLLIRLCAHPYAGERLKPCLSGAPACHFGAVNASQRLEDRDRSVLGACSFASGHGISRDHSNEFLEISMTTSIWSLIIIAFLLILLAVSVRLYLKLRSVHLMLFKVKEDCRILKERVVTQSVNVTQQDQALRALEHDLQLDRPLPPMRGWMASPDFLLALARHVAEHQPRIIVEVGSGVSTLVLARACQMAGTGHIYSLDAAAEFASRTEAMLRDWGLADYATVIGAPLTERRIGDRTWTWYGFEELPVDGIDMLIVDGPPESTGRLARYPAGPVFLPKLRAGGACFVDDADRPDETEMVRLWRREFGGLEATDLYCEKGAILLKRVA
jgi:predicted O-methyltransferase YrrM